MRFDRPFKELIVTCFLEFVAFFMPDIYGMMDPESIEFLDKELFTDIAVEERSEADVVVKARVRGEDSFFLIHVENQATTQPRFAERMFRYFAKLYGKHHLPIYPVAVLSWESPRREEPDTFSVHFSERRVLDFRFHAIQLNRLDWRNYLHSDNPVAAALMTRMNVAMKDRPRVKLEALKSLALMGLNPAKAEVTSWFVDNMLPLDEQQQREFEQRLNAEDVREKEVVMEMTTSWQVKGRQEGRQEGRNALARIVLKFLRRQVGPLSEEQSRRVDALSLSQLDRLGDALLDFGTSADLDAWLAGEDS